MRAPKSFEDGMARLETILSQMQSEETTLSESVKLYTLKKGGIPPDFRCSGNLVTE